MNRVELKLTIIRFTGACCFFDLLDPKSKPGVHSYAMNLSAIPGISVQVTFLGPYF